MWKFDEDPLDYTAPGRGRSYSSAVKIELPPLFSGEDRESFSCWSRQYEVAVRALVAGNGSDYDYELARLLPTRLSKAAFLLWDSLPAAVFFFSFRLFPSGVATAVQADYSAVKEKLQEAFRQRPFLDSFRANHAARRRASGESLEVYAADIGKLVQEAFPNYGEVAQKEEKFRRFLAGLDPCLRAKCQEQGATDLEEALIIAGRCDMTRETLRSDYTYPPVSPAPISNPTTSLVHSIAGETGWQRTMDRLVGEMKEMRKDITRLSDENERLKYRDRGRERSSPIQEQCLCKCGGRGCQSRHSWTEPRRRSPDPGWRGRHVDRYSGPGGRSPPPYNRSASPRRQRPRPSREISYDNSVRRRGVRFLSPSREDPVRQQGNEV